MKIETIKNILIGLIVNFCIIGFGLFILFSCAEVSRAAETSREGIAKVEQAYTKDELKLYCRYLETVNKDDFEDMSLEDKRVFKICFNDKTLQTEGFDHDPFDRDPQGLWSCDQYSEMLTDLGPHEFLSRLHLKREIDHIRSNCGEVWSEYLDLKKEVEALNKDLSDEAKKDVLYKYNAVIIMDDVFKKRLNSEVLKTKRHYDVLSAWNGEICSHCESLKTCLETQLAVLKNNRRDIKSVGTYKHRWSSGVVLSRSSLFEYSKNHDLNSEWLGIVYKPESYFKVKIKHINSGFLSSYEIKNFDFSERHFKMLLKHHNTRTDIKSPLEVEAFEVDAVRGLMVLKTDTYLIEVSL